MNIVLKIPVNLWENREMYGIMSGRNKREGHWYYWDKFINL